MAGERRTGPLPPRTARVKLGALRPVDDVGDEDDLDDVEVRGLNVEELVWTGRRRFGSSRLVGLVAAHWTAPGASLSGSVVDGAEVVALSASESGWWNVEVTQSRFGSAELYDTNWRNVTFSRCKLGYLNLRHATMTDVRFADCVITDLDLAGATATRVAFDGCRIERLELTGSRLTDVDLRGARLAEVGNLEGLKGATITLEQLLDLAPALAGRLGILVE